MYLSHMRRVSECEIWSMGAVFRLLCVSVCIYVHEYVSIISARVKPYCLRYRKLAPVDFTNTAHHHRRRNGGRCFQRAGGGGGGHCCSLNHFLWNHHVNLPQIRNCCQWTRQPLPLPRPSPSVPKEKALSSASLLRELGGGLRRRSWNETGKDQRPHEESISHMSVPPSHAVGCSLNGQKEKMEGGFQLISLSCGGLLNSSRSRCSAEGAAKAPLCMRKPGLIQIFIRTDRDVFPVFTSQKEFCPFFPFETQRVRGLSSLTFAL